MESSMMADKNLRGLQKRYRNGDIKEKDMSESEIKRLKELYIEQINFLDKVIEKDKKDILRIKNRFTLKKIYYIIL